MNLALLFWFYKDIDICKNRLELIRKHNPDIKIYGLYGGDHAEAHTFDTGLSSYLDDFYTCPYQDSYWKWRHGDLTILDWYEKRGKNLDWDSVCIIQWDLLVFDNIRTQFSDIKKDELYVTAYGELEERHEEQWDWTASNSKERPDYIAFREYIKETYGYNTKPLRSVFVLAVLPRLFLEKYLEVENKEVGFLEYKIPTYADIFNIPIFKKNLGTKWFDTTKEEDQALNGNAVEIPEERIRKELAKPDGRRLFHPYFKIWK